MSDGGSGGQEHRPHSLNVSPAAHSPWPPTDPNSPPFNTDIKATTTYQTSAWQNSYLDATSMEDLGPWKKRPRAGPLDLNDGHQVGEFGDSGHWHQV
jgi:hypothetical protein